MVQSIEARSVMENLECVEKLMKIDHIRNAKEKVNKIYLEVKSHNFLFSFWLNTAEKSCKVVFNGAQPVLNTFQRPIKFADSCVCKVMDGIQETVPAILEAPVAVISSGCSKVLNSSIGQIVLCSADKMLSVAECAVTFVPEIKVTDVDSEDKEKNAVVLDQVKNIYSIATTPLQITGRLIQGSRNVIRQYKKEDTPKELQPRGLIERILNIPVKGLHFIGMLSEKQSICNRQGDFDLPLSPEEVSKRLQEVQEQFSTLETAADSNENTELNEFTVIEKTEKTEETKPSVPPTTAKPESDVRKSKSLSNPAKIVKPITIPLRRKLGVTTPTDKSFQRKPLPKSSIQTQMSASKDLRKLRSSSVQSVPQTKPRRVASESST